VLASLIRTGDAHSPRTADAAGQPVIFEDDSATHLPRCELTGATTALHLVVYGEGHGIIAKLVATEPRCLLRKVTTLSVPLAALTVAVLATLENIGKLPVGSPAAKTLRAWLRQDLEASWRKLAAQRSEPQQSLELGPTPDESPLESQGHRLPGLMAWRRGIAERSLGVCILPRPLDTGRPMVKPAQLPHSRPPNPAA
jgi:hypothetical protein